MGSIGGSELFLILIIALLVFGPRKLPEIGRTLGRTMAGFRRAASDFKMDLEREVNIEKVRETTKEITDARDELKSVATLDPVREAVGLETRPPAAPSRPEEARPEEACPEEGRRDDRAEQDRPEDAGPDGETAGAAKSAAEAGKTS